MTPAPTKSEDRSPEYPGLNTRAATAGAAKTSVSAVVLPTPPTPSRGLRQADTDLSWGAPAGLAVRGPNDENLVIFRMAVGINWPPPGTKLRKQKGGDAPQRRGTMGFATPARPRALRSLSTVLEDAASSPKSGISSGAIPLDDSPLEVDEEAAAERTLEEGRKHASGVYQAVIRHANCRGMQASMMNWLLYTCYFLQILIGAALTGLGAGAGAHPMAIVVLGIVNTVIAGLLALVKGQGLPERLRSGQREFRKLQDWIEETESLLSVGIIGRDRREVGVLVESVFRKYHAAQTSEEDSRPEAYVSQGVAKNGPGDMLRQKLHLP